MRDLQRGFSLIETLIAATIVVVALVGLAQLFVLAMAANQGAKSRTVATILAQEKMEELMASDTEVASGLDFADVRGRAIGNLNSPPPGTVFVRRWSCASMPSSSAALVLQVWVTLLGDGEGVAAARLVSLKTSRRP